MVASLSSFKWNTFTEIAERKRKQQKRWVSCNAVKTCKTSCSSAHGCNAVAWFFFLFFFFFKTFFFVVFDFGGMGGQLNDFTKRQRATTAGWERRRLTRTDPRLADSIFWMLVLLSNLPTPLLICAGDRISFHQLMNIHEGRVFDAQAAEKMWGLMSERCCSENWPPPISSTPPVDNDRVSFSVSNSFVLLWIIMSNRLYNFACNYWCVAL